MSEITQEELIEKCKLTPKERVNSLHESRGANHTEIDDNLLTNQLQKALPIITQQIREELEKCKVRLKGETKGTFHKAVLLQGDFAMRSKDWNSFWDAIIGKGGRNE